MDTARAFLTGKTAIVTGGGAGIGRGIAEAFVAFGARVVVLEIDPERAARVREALPEQHAAVVTGDARTGDDLERALAVARETFGDVHIPFRMLGISANIMSLGGIAIAVGTLVDAAIVVVEQTHKKLEEWERTGRREDHRSVIVTAFKQVASPSFFALLVIAVSFLAVLTLEAEEGRLFRPLAYTKTFTMIIAAVLAITLDPALRLSVTRLRPFGFRPPWLARTANAVLVGAIHPEEKHPVSRFLIRLYEPAASWALRRKWLVIGAALALIVATVPVYLQLGSEFMPPLDEWALFYMPTTMPGISVEEARKLAAIDEHLRPSACYRQPRWQVCQPC